MHVADGHGPVLDSPVQILRWQLFQAMHALRRSPSSRLPVDHARCWRAWTERPVRSTPSTAVHERVGVERRQLYLAVRRHMARMARAAETRGLAPKSDNKTMCWRENKQLSAAPASRRPGRAGLVAPPLRGQKILSF